MMLLLAFSIITQLCHLSKSSHFNLKEEEKSFSMSKAHYRYIKIHHMEIKAFVIQFRDAFMALAIVQNSYSTSCYFCFDDHNKAQLSVRFHWTALFHLWLILQGFPLNNMTDVVSSFTIRPTVREKHISFPDSC